MGIPNNRNTTNFMGTITLYELFDLEVDRCREKDLRTLSIVKIQLKLNSNYERKPIGPSYIILEY